MKKIIFNTLVLLIFVFQVTLAQTAKLSTNFNKTLKSYYQLKDALAADEPAKAIEYAKALQETLKNVPHTGFKSDKHHTLWMQESAKIGTHAGKLSQRKVLAEQRKEFEGISASMIQLTSVLKLNSDEAYVQYCPMGKYSWLSESRKIENPYYGAEMFDCGTVKDVFGKN